MRRSRGLNQSAFFLAALCVACGLFWCGDAYRTNCTGAFRHTLMEAPAGLPIVMHEYSVRPILSPNLPPDPRNVVVIVFGTYRMNLQTLLAWFVAISAFAVWRIWACDEVTGQAGLPSSHGSQSP